MRLDRVNFHERQERTQYIYHAFGRYFGKNILDVGCDQCVLKTLITGIDYLGMDVAGTPDISLNLEKIDKLPCADAAFDCVICADVLEHLDNLHAVFNELIRVSRRHIIIAWPNNWVNARVPLERGHGSFKHYGLPFEKPLDRHKWFFSLSEARAFVHHHIKQRRLELVEERINEKPKFFPVRLLRHLRYPVRENYNNRYAHTYWTVLKKNT